MTTKQIAIDRRAPVVADGHVLIAASPEAVWAVLADIAAWSQIYPELRDLQIDGPVEEGQTFSFKSGPGRIDATISELRSNERLAFTGQGMGATSIYVFELARTLGGVKLTAEQSMSGLAVRAAKRMLQGIAQSSLDDWLDAIKQRVVENADG